MRRSLSIAAAYISLIVGAGFASGQEIVLFFTSFAMEGIIACFIALILFALLGMKIAEYGSRLQVTSHALMVRFLFGKRLGYLVDLIITFCLLGISIVMIAASGSLMAQQFQLNSIFGSFLMTIIMIITLNLHIDHIIKAISMLTPYLLLLMSAIAIYSVFVSEGIDLEIATTLPSAAPNWFISPLLYVSFNIVFGFSMLTIIGGAEKNIHQARLGGFLGGLGIGLLLLCINIGLLFHVNDIINVPLPTLYIADKISPIIGLLMSLVLIGMIFSSAVGSLHAFTVRLFNREHPFYLVRVILITSITFIASSVGFTKLVTTLYPITGYIGIIIILGITFQSGKDWLKQILTN